MLADFLHLILPSPLCRLYPTSCASARRSPGRPPGQVLDIVLRPFVCPPAPFCFKTLMPHACLLLGSCVTRSFPARLFGDVWPQAPDTCVARVPLLWGGEVEARLAAHFRVEGSGFRLVTSTRSQSGIGALTPAPPAPTVVIGDDADVVDQRGEEVMVEDEAPASWRCDPCDRFQNDVVADVPPLAHYAPRFLSVVGLLSFHKDYGPSHALPPLPSFPLHSTSAVAPPLRNRAPAPSDRAASAPTSVFRESDLLCVRHLPSPRGSIELPMLTLLASWCEDEP
ncbi:hypothetical protein DFH06DRAFT_1351487 [Mycena polygramma]|nr:hypothetical protein DFH06DRAFT_1351487 [Mycena polygramma]